MVYEVGVVVFHLELGAIMIFSDSNIRFLQTMRAIYGNTCAIHRVVFTYSRVYHKITKNQIKKAIFFENKRKKVINTGNSAPFYQKVRDIAGEKFDEILGKIVTEGGKTA